MKAVRAASRMQPQHGRAHLGLYLHGLSIAEPSNACRNSILRDGRTAQGSAHVNARLLPADYLTDYPISGRVSSLHVMRCHAII